jgi:hypothetical protein
VALALAADVGEVWAVDQEPESVEFGREKAERLGVRNIHWVAGSAEELALDGSFDLVTIGNAFHRLDRDAVIRRLTPHLADRGSVALLWSEPPWRGERPWQWSLDETVERWQDELGARDRVLQGWETAISEDPHADVLTRAGLTYEGRFDFSTVERWTLDSLIGYVYSTSVLNRNVLADRADEFEHDMQTRLAPLADDGVFEQESAAAYELARR